VDLRDSRYNQVLHMVSAAKGAENFYLASNKHVTNRAEDITKAAKLDEMLSQV